jgi:hypothetical protein
MDPIPSRPIANPKRPPTPKVRDDKKALKEERKKFKDDFKEMLTERRAELKERLWQIFMGEHPNIKPSDSLGAFDRMAAYGEGKPTEHIIQENRNTDLDGKSVQEMAKRAKEILDELNGQSGQGSGAAEADGKAGEGEGTK